MTPHTTDRCPVQPDALVVIDLGDGAPVVDRADAFNWGPGAGPEGEGRIVAYDVLVPQRQARPPHRAQGPRVSAVRRRIPVASYVLRDSYGFAQ